jgi:hypothetical protein
MSAHHLRRAGQLGLLVVAGLGAVACDLLRNEPELPTVEEAAIPYLAMGMDAEYALNGNVFEIRVVQPRNQLERGGSLWAKVGPYVYVFSPATRAVFEDNAAIAGVRVITVTPDGDEVARALLRREVMREAKWRRALNLLGLALQEGTQRPTRLEALVSFGEENTDYQYSPDWVRPPGGS